MTRWTGKTLGLALGGGGVRGFCHIGVLKVLEEDGIAIDLIAGTSAGALIGGAYASGASPQEINDKVESYIQSPEFRSSTLREMGLSMGSSEKTFWEKTRDAFRQRYFLVSSFFKPSILPLRDFESLIRHFSPDIEVRETKIPFYPVATDLISGKRIAIRGGSLRRAVLASCAVPGAVDPIRQGDWLLADGGITSLVPVLTAREAGADAVIAVVVNREKTVSDEFETAQEIVYRAGDITSDKLEEVELLQADVIIRPRIGDFHWSDFSRAKALIQEGETAARLALGDIREAIPIYKRVLRMLRKFIPGAAVNRESQESSLAPCQKSEISQAVEAPERSTSACAPVHSPMRTDANPKTTGTVDPSSPSPSR
jgi:NTE family protein